MAKKAKKKATTRATARRKPATRRATAKPAARRAAAKPARAKTTKKGLALTSHAPSLTVNDAAASIAFYTNVLGFVLKDKWERNGVLLGGELESGGVRIYLGQDDWAKGRDRVKGEGVRIYWYTDQDIDALAEAIKTRGGVLSSDPRDEWGMRFFSLEDPTGYKITIGSER
jgi:uncharacterized glyoxalase superfamily protein PhnB